MKDQKLPRVEYISCYQGPRLELANPAAFARTVDCLSPSVVFWMKNAVLRDRTSGILVSSGTGHVGDKVFCVSNGLAYYVDAEDFETFEELYVAGIAGFCDARSYRESRGIGDISAEEYKNFLISGYSDYPKYTEVVKSGLEEVFFAWKKYESRLKPRMGRPRVRNLRQFIENDFFSLSGFSLDSLPEIFEAFEAGFWSRNGFELYKALGPECKNVFDRIITLGINSKKEMNILLIHGIKNRKQWDLFTSDSDLADYYTDGDILVFRFIDYTEHLKKASWNLDDLRSFYQKEVLEYYGISCGPLRDRGKEISNDGFLKQLASHHTIAERYYLDEKQKTLNRRTFSRQERETVILDLNNILLHGSSEGEEPTAKFLNLEAVIAKLRVYGVKRIVAFADANYLYLRSEEKLDPGLIESLVEQLVIVPNGSIADTYILNYAVNNPCLIVSNDKYQDHISQQRILRERKIGRRLLEFLITPLGEAEFNVNRKEMESTFEKNDSPLIEFFRK